MSTSNWTLVAGGTAGLALVLFGAGMLITGRAPDATVRAFRNIRDAGRYHLLFGLGLLLVVFGTMMRGLIAVIAATVAMIMIGVAVVRFRPRGHRRPPGGDAAVQR